MINETAWFKYLLTLEDADAISREIVKEIEQKNKLPFDLFIFYGLNPETINQTEYEEMINKILKIKK
jgi:hypothetical protein